jgi:hypothetical protein
MVRKNHRHSKKLSKWIFLVLEIEKMIVYVHDAMLKKMMSVIGINPESNDTDIIVGFMSYGNLIFTFNQINRRLIEVKKP